MAFDPYPDKKYERYYEDKDGKRGLTFPSYLIKSVIDMWEALQDKSGLEYVGELINSERRDIICLEWIKAEIALSNVTGGAENRNDNI